MKGREGERRKGIKIEFSSTSRFEDEKFYLFVGQNIYIFFK
jgi:hypothetical protein